MWLRDIILVGACILGQGTVRGNEVIGNSADDVAVNLLLTSQDTVPFDSLSHPFEVEQLYVGGLTGLTVDPENAEEIGRYVSLRVGGKVSYDLFKNLNANIWGALDVSNDTILGLGQMYAQYTIGKVSILGGYQGTPITTLRPLPYTGGGHVEPAAYGVIPGGALGWRIDVKGGVDISGGVSYRDGNTEYGFKVSVDQEKWKYALGALYIDQETLALATSGKYRSVSGMFAYRREEGIGTIGSNISVELSSENRQGSMIPYGVVKWSIDDQFEKAEVGVLLSGKVDIGGDLCKVLLGPGCDLVNREIMGYLYIGYEFY